MDDLFRFLVLRAPLPSHDASVELGEGESRLITELEAAQNQPGAAQNMHGAALRFTESKSFLHNAAELDMASAMAELSEALDAESHHNLASLKGIIATVFDQDAAKVASSVAFKRGRERLRDSLIAIKLAPEAAPAGLSALVRAARIMAIIQRVAKTDATLDHAGAVAAALSAPLVLPPGAIPPSLAPKRPPAPSTAEADRLAARHRELSEEVAKFHQAIESVRTASPATGGAPEDRSVAHVPSAATRATTSREGAARDPLRPLTTHMLDVNLPSLSPALLQSLPDVAQSALGIRSGESTTMTAAEAEAKLRGAYRLSLSRAARELASQGENDLFKLFPSANLYPVTELGEHDDATDAAPAALTDVPKTHGTFKPAGIGDLLVTRQHTVRYELGDVAHIENVAKGETLARETRRLDTTETTVAQETETFRQDQRDLETAGRFNLQQESEQVVKSDRSRIPGQPSSDSYGSLVESGGSKQLSKKEAETYSRDVTSRATTNLTQRVRTQVTTRTLRELEEKATHGFANASSAEVIVYQWVDRVVQAQVFNYGKRLFYDIVVPEPAAFLARALASRSRQLPVPPRPVPFTLKPTLLNEWNWDYYSAGYGASGVGPPPPPEVTVARTFSGMAQNPFSDSDQLRFTMMASGIEVPIPEGYQATKVKARIRWSGWEGYLDLVVGATFKRFHFPTDWYFEGNLTGETGAIPATVMIPEGQAQFTLALEIVCALTDERMMRWQAAAHAAILGAARERLADYEQQLANLHAALRLLTTGTSVERKNRMVRQEIQKACLEILSAQHFDGLAAVEHSPQGYPQPFLPNIEQYGRYLRFLEHAFEWEQMTWRYAPYFWGRKPYWVQAITRDDPDPAFVDFLHAGAARALVPVRPGFEPSVLAFMTDGTVPQLDALTEFTSPLYLPLLQELRETDTALDRGKPYGDSWEVRLPTTLIALRRDGTFPRWQQTLLPDGTGPFVPVTGEPIP